jgi:hypothetical protein
MGLGTEKLKVILKIDSVGDVVKIDTLSARKGK